MPVAVSPGRSGFGPQLSLAYDSGAGNGPFGLGWTLPLPSITRRTDKGLPQYRDAQESDVYILSGAEDLVPVLNADGTKHADDSMAPGYRVHRYRPRVEASFACIERWTRTDGGETHWRTITSDNVTTLYGLTGESRVADPSDPRRIFTWLICQSYDDKGNAIVYEYAAEDAANVDLTRAHERNRGDAARTANRYLKRIRYGNTSSRLIQPDLSETTWLFEVVFDYEEGHHELLPSDAERREFVRAATSAGHPWSARQDAFSSYRAGFEIRTYRLCRRVLMFHHFAEELGTPDCLVRATEIAYRETPVASFLTSVTHAGYVRQPDGSYLKETFPAVEFHYSQAAVRGDVREVDTESLANLPGGLDGGKYQWLDLDGEGLQSVLAEHEGGWFYKRNISALTFAREAGIPAALARFEPLAEVVSLPAVPRAALPAHEFLDLAGDGQLDCVVLDRALGGFFERTGDERWEGFTAMPSLPNIDWSDPNLRFVDIDGDGLADVLVTEDEAFTWYPSLAEDGFGPPIHLGKARSEDEGPAVVFADTDHAIFVADMSGDGLADIVRIRNGEICYWPNLGYGRFGAKVSMDRAPWFDAPDVFDQQRVRLADIDGSGVTDIIYIARDGVRLYFNQSGNGWSDASTVDAFPQVDDLSHVQAIDLLGTGTACLVWMSSLAGDARCSMRYIDLMGAEKPHLIVAMRNNLGAEARIFYAPSTKFYLADRAAGQPWVTRLPFVVHVVERLDTYDLVSRNRFVTRFSYHHGFYDGVEREFRGFGRVDQYDTHELGVLTADGVFPQGANVDAASYVPTVLTRTWFHTGGFFDAARVSKQFAHEYWRESDAVGGAAGLPDASGKAMLLPDTVLPANLEGDEIPEAFRSLKGAVLRQESYALDGSDRADRPYTVSERNYTIRRVQPRGVNRHAVFFTHARETVDFQYERTLYDIGGRLLADPRVSHSMVLAVDDFGNPLRSVAIAYGRRHDDPDPLLTSEDRARQKKVHATCVEADYTNAIDEPHAYRSPIAADTRGYEIVNVSPQGAVPDITNLFGFDEMARNIALAADGHHDLPFEDVDAVGATDPAPYRRLTDRVRALFRKDDLTIALPLGRLESLAEPYETYQLAFTAGLLAVYRRGQENLLPDASSVLRDDGGYAAGDEMVAAGLFPATDSAGQWWVPSGRIFHTPDAADGPDVELAAARAHFFMSRRFRDAFGRHSTVQYDEHELLPLETKDAIGNTVTVGERLPGGAIANGNDYRVLQASLITDANGNRSAVRFDALGLVAGTVVMGKPSDQLGDSFGGFTADLTAADLDDFFLDPRGPVADRLLAGATTRIIHDLHRVARSGSGDTPAYAATIARERHVADLAPGEVPKRQVSLSFSDGFGRTIQTKAQADPGPLIDGGPVTPRRWIASGWTVFDNKGNPVRQYEPFFDGSHEFRFGAQAGVSATRFYDPLQRAVATLHPNHAWEKVVFDPWRQSSFDVNDTVGLDPSIDPDVRRFFERLPQEVYRPTWHALRTDPAFATERTSRWPDPKTRGAEVDAAAKVEVHADTPSTIFLDSLGRTFLTVAHNRFLRNGQPIEERYATRVDMDVDGNQRAVRDAAGRTIIRRVHDMLGVLLHQAGMEAGDRWMLADVGGKPIRAWDSRGHTFRTEYDELRRAVRSFVAAIDPQQPDREILFGKTEYGEGQPGDTALNLRTRPFRVCDSAGVSTIEAYDFKGNALRSRRVLAVRFDSAPDWAASPSLEQQAFTASTTYDALNRAAAIVTPDGSRYQPSFNDAGLPDALDVSVRGVQPPTGFARRIEYNAKAQRTRLEHGNGAVTTYEYDALTFRLMRLATVRPGESTPVRDWRYAYDPAGNITAIRDEAQQTVFFSNQAVSPDGDYIHDAAYRLIVATGREHIGQAAQPQTSWDDRFRVRLPHPGDGQAMRRYTERYEYDAVGNLQQVAHHADNGNWTRTYEYDEPSLLDPAKSSNRLSRTIVGSSPPEPYTYDAHGSMTSMPHLTVMEVDFRNQLTAVSTQSIVDGTPETTHYVYGDSGERVRKVTLRQNGTRARERIYLAQFEVYREYDAAGTAVTLERETLHMGSGQQRLAVVETRTQGSDAAPAQVTRYLFGNHLGSVAMELDESAQLISYEEYYPYGSTSYQAGPNALEVSRKRWRYGGMERDEESGLDYHAVRYYAPWLGRWTSSDPIGMTGGINSYAYAAGNPVRMTDANGMDPKDGAKCSVVPPPPLDPSDVDDPMAAARDQLMGQVGGWDNENAPTDFEQNILQARAGSNDVFPGDPAGGKVLHLGPALQEVVAGRVVTGEQLRNAQAIECTNDQGDVFRGWVTHERLVDVLWSREGTIINAMGNGQGWSMEPGLGASLLNPVDLLAGGMAGKLVRGGGRMAVGALEAATSNEVRGVGGVWVADAEGAIAHLSRNRWYSRWLPGRTQVVMSRGETSGSGLFKAIMRTKRMGRGLTILSGTHGTEAGQMASEAEDLVLQGGRRVSEWVTGGDFLRQDINLGRWLAMSHPERFPSVRVLDVSRLSGRELENVLLSGDDVYAAWCHSGLSRALGRAFDRINLGM